MAPTPKRVDCSCGRQFKDRNAMQQHLRDSLIHRGSSTPSSQIPIPTVSNNTANTTANTNTQQPQQQQGRNIPNIQLADLRNRHTFPPFTGLPDENDIDFDFYQPSPHREWTYIPSRQWCFLGEIVQVDSFLRLRLLVEDVSSVSSVSSGFVSTVGNRAGGGGRGRPIPIAFYTDTRGFEYRNAVKVGYTIAVMDANRHGFLDMSEGVRVEEEDALMIFPLKLSHLLTLSDRLQRYSTFKMEGGEKIRICHGCDQSKATSTLRKCSGCGIFWYCDKTCQTKGWSENDHKNDCKAITSGLMALFQQDWDRYNE